jgi:hypothetical protein
MTPLEPSISSFLAFSLHTSRSQSDIIVDDVFMAPLEPMRLNLGYSLSLQVPKLYLYLGTANDRTIIIESYGVRAL